MKLIINKFRRVIWKIIGLPDSLVVTYKSDFPDGKLIGKPEQIGRFGVVDYGGNVKIGYGVFILSVSTITGSKNIQIIRKSVIIGDNVEIGSNTVILPGVTIGDNSIIGANSLVNKDIPSNSVAVGSPVRVIKTKGE